ncbi:bile acid:sodium symporter family protein [Corynebacterium lizhenjunii]|uniref:bile acid:sodium symporter family protein n=1 Tax=Corynebacterium lizhenjunii TaxID=2709394 RepID=UPI001F1E5276|nr:bile acid:sodium symporter family protein [Corynebacterium lizhenjunii]
MAKNTGAAGAKPAAQEGISHLERLSVSGFPIVVLACAIVALIIPDTVAPITSIVPELLMLVMFSMGLTLTLPDLAQVVRRPIPIFIGVVAQFVVMPVSAYFLAKALGLNDALTIGLILLGSVPGGTASNVMAYLAKGDVALSVAMTSVSTLVSPIMTPLLMLWLAGETTEIDGAGMTLSLAKTVLIPVLLGLGVRLVAGKLVDKVLPVLPWIAIFVIGSIVLGVVGKSADKLLAVGLVVFVGVTIQNFLGFAGGFFAAKVTGHSERHARTTAIEVATQNSALASSLALEFFSPEAAIPGVLAAAWCNLTGAMFAAWMRKRPLPEEATA